MKPLRRRDPLSDAPKRHVLPTPDAWSYDWALRSGIMLFASFILPGGGLVMSKFGNEWSWNEVGHGGFGHAVGVLMPLPAGIASLAAAMYFRGRRRTRALLAVSVAVAAAWLVLSPWPAWGPFVLPRTVRGPLVDAGSLLSAAAVAVGSHLRRRYPRAGLPRALAAIGGAVLVVLCAAVWLDPQPLHAPPYPEIDLRNGLIPVALLGIVGIGLVAPHADAPGLCRIFGWLARVDLFVVLAVLIVADSAKFALMLVGATIAVPLGFGAWLEGRMSERAGVKEPQSLADVFR